MKSCVVLDLDSTLVDMFGESHNWNLASQEFRKNALERIINIDAEGSFFWGTKRPHLDLFLKTCFETFDIVGVWSAGAKHYVREVVKEIMIDKGYCPHFVWSKEYCVPTFLPETSYIVKQKPLAKVIDTFPEINPNKIIIVDDKKFVCEQDRTSHIWLKAWGSGYHTVHEDDDTLLRISEWMKNLKEHENFKYVSMKEILPQNASF